MTRKNNRSIFIKFFTSYILIGAIPLIVLGSVFYYLNVINYQKNVKDSNLAKLVQVKNQVDLDFKVLKDVTYHISNNKNMLSNMLPEGNQVKGMEIESQLQAYMDNCSFLDDILFYFRGDNNIYLTDGKYYYYDFETRAKKDMNWSKSSFFTSLNSIVAPRIKRIDKKEIDNNQNNQLLILMYPVPYLSTYPQGTVVYMIKQTELLSKFENFLGDFNGYIFIFDNYYNILLSYNKGVPSKDIDIIEKQFNKSKGTGVFETNIKNENYTVMRTVSEDIGWSYVVAMPSSEFFKTVNTMKNVFLIIILVLGLGGGLLAFGLSISNYRPIKKLVSYIKNQESQLPNVEVKNELEVIRFIVEKNYKKNRELIVQVDAQRPFVKDQALIKILRGKIKDIHELDYILKCSNVQLQGLVYFTMVLSIKKNDGIYINIEDILKLFENIYFIGGRGYGVELVQEKMIAIIVSLEKDSNNIKDTQFSIVNDIELLVEKNFGIKPDIGIGNTYKDILKLNTSFLEASTVLFDNLTNNSSNIYFFDEIKISNDQMCWYPIVEQSLFIQSLKKGDIKVALETLNVMANKITEGTTSYMMVRCICFDIINNVIKTINNMNIEKFSEEIKKIAEFNALDEFIVGMEIFSVKFCEFIDGLEEIRNNELKNNIITYVNNNYMSRDISLDDIANKFDISSTYVSRFFKDKTGVNFIEYITNLRMDYVKKQLRNTDKHIKEIVKGVGYIDAASFARKFKTLEGITPGQYRYMTKKLK